MHRISEVALCSDNKRDRGDARTFASILLNASFRSASSVVRPAFFSFSLFFTHLN